MAARLVADVSGRLGVWGGVVVVLIFLTWACVYQFRNQDAFAFAYS